MDLQKEKYTGDITVVQDEPERRLTVKPFFYRTY